MKKGLSIDVWAVIIAALVIVAILISEVRIPW